MVLPVVVCVHSVMWCCLLWCELSVEITRYLSEDSQISEVLPFDGQYISIKGVRSSLKVGEGSKIMLDF